MAHLCDTPHGPKTRGFLWLPTSYSRLVSEGTAARMHADAGDTTDALRGVRGAALPNLALPCVSVAHKPTLSRHTAARGLFSTSAQGASCGIWSCSAVRGGSPPKAAGWRLKLCPAGGCGACGPTGSLRPPRRRGHSRGGWRIS